jgi:hypothetical protein
VAYRSASDTGTDILDLWTTNLASVTFYEYVRKRLADRQSPEVRFD